MWNTLPVEVTSVPHKAGFKRVLKDFFNNSTVEY